MKKIGVVILILSLLVVGLTFAEVFFKTELNKGKNEICLNYSLGYASELVKIHPEIETITYVQENKTIGYVNILGGIGKDFLIEENKTYEINSKKNITIETK
jgi:hypothetical protein